MGLVKFWDPDDSNRPNFPGGGSGGATFLGNLPAGLTEYDDLEWDTTLTPTGWSYQDRESQHVITAEATAPSSTTGVLECQFPTGFTGNGQGPGINWTNTNPASKQYICFWWRMNAGFQGHGSGAQKVLFFQAADNQEAVIIGFTGPVEGPFQLRVRGAGTESYREPNVGDGALTTGQWHLIEMFVDLDDGILKWWLDGDLDGSFTSIAFSQNTEFGQLEITPTWGGIHEDAKFQDDFMQFDRMAIHTGTAE